MKKAILLPLCVLLCVGCAARTEDFSQALSEAYAAETYAITSHVSADLGEIVREYTLRYTGSGGEGDIEVLAPEEIAGMVIHYDESGEQTLHYDGAILYMGEAELGEITPVTLMPTLLKLWQGGYALDSGMENYDGRKTLAVTHFLSDTCQTHTQFDTETLYPVCTEVFESGRRTLIAVFDDIHTLL